MANYNQVVGSAIDGGDFTFRNASGSDIAAGVAVKIDTANLATASLATGVIPTTNEAGAIGITVEKILANSVGVGRVRLLGVAVATASGTVTAGDIVMAGAAGVVLTQTAAKRQLGYALTSGLTTESVRVFICPALNA